jgi:hypothetical protein
MNQRHRELLVAGCGARGVRAGMLARLRHRAVAAPTITTQASRDTLQAHGQRNVIHEAENAMPTPSLTVLLVQSLTLASLMSPASTVEYDRLPQRRDHPSTPGPDQWSSDPLVQFERRDDPSWPQVDDDSSGSRVALAELVRAIGS